MSNIPLNIDFQQVLLHLLNFAILFAIIYFLLYRPVKNFMDKRKSEYEEMDKQAEEKLAQAQQMKETYESRLQSADDEINARMAEAARKSQQKCMDLEEEAKHKARETLDKARKQAETEKKKILNEARDSVVELAQEAAKKAVFENFSDAFDEFLDIAEQEIK